MQSHTNSSPGTQEKPKYILAREDYPSNALISAELIFQERNAWYKKVCYAFVKGVYGDPKIAGRYDTDNAITFKLELHQLRGLSLAIIRNLHGQSLLSQAHRILADPRKTEHYKKNGDNGQKSEGAFEDVKRIEVTGDFHFEQRDMRVCKILFHNGYKGNGKLCFTVILPSYDAVAFAEALDQLYKKGMEVNRDHFWKREKARAKAAEDARKAKESPGQGNNAAPPAAHDPPQQQAPDPQHAQTQGGDQKISPPKPARRTTDEPGFGHYSVPEQTGKNSRTAA